MQAWLPAHHRLLRRVAGTACHDQTAEPRIKSEHSEAERTRGNERPMMFGLALGDVSKHPID